MIDVREIKTSLLTHRYKNGYTITFSPLTVKQGQHCLITGRSGSGKTTLLHLLCGLLRPQQGSVHIFGTSIYQLSNRALDHFRGTSIGIIFQKPHLLPSLTVTENLSLAQELAGLKKDGEQQQYILSKLSILEKAESYPTQLSEGQAQRVAIARALINRPKLLVADEPTSALDDNNAESVLNLLISQATDSKTSLIIATHDQRIKNKIPTIYNL
ncbi:MAG TPA: ATP-binding cassette domain-containing protein [Pseudosphingobacterium sp.]|nr:ATP-binding cassette domain-containing protein [Pseudosphingobacterium sp.]